MTTDWQDKTRVQLADIIIDDIIANPDPAIKGYPGMVARTGIPKERIQDLKPMLKTRIRVRYPKHQLDWDSAVHSWRAVDRVDVIRTKTLRTHVKTAVTHLNYVADIERMDNLTPAHKLAATMAKEMVSFCERMSDYLAEAIA